MSEEIKGWRAVPPALVVALAAWSGFMVFRIAYVLGKTEMEWSPRFGIAGDGISLACYTLGLLGALELARRATGRLSVAAKIAAAGFALGLALELASTLINFDLHFWDRKWLRDLLQYGYWLSWVGISGGFVWAVWEENRKLAAIGAVVALACDLPPFIATPIFEGFKDYKTVFALDSGLRIMRTVMVLVLASAVSRGATPTDRLAGADGLRLAARGMWLRVIVAVSIVLMTLMAMTSARSGGEGIFKMLRFMMMAGACATVIAFAMFGLGVGRTARATIVNLPRVPLALSAACSMWCCGVELSKLPFIYRMLYNSGGYGDRNTDYMTAFATAEPLVAIAAVALVAIAISKFASERTTIALQSEAQGKGIGIICMMLASVAIQNWLMPKAAERASSSSEGTVMVLMLLAAAAGLIAVVMIARLCSNAADEINREPGIPTASVIPPG